MAAPRRTGPMEGSETSRVCSHLRQLNPTITPSPTPTSASACTHQHFIDVSFADTPVQLHAIAFANYYCASVTILYRSKNLKKGYTPEVAPTADRGLSGCSGSASSAGVQQQDRDWQVLVSAYKLMANPHCEDDAQTHHEITVKDFQSTSAIYSLRLCLSQVR